MHSPYIEDFKQVMQLKILPKTMLLVTMEPAAVKATALDWLIIKLFIMSLSKRIICTKIAKFGNQMFGLHFFQAL